ncbi:MAG: Isoquinoline 1-oxidoreductase subunit [Solimonas sp.]
MRHSSSAMRGLCAAAGLLFCLLSPAQAASTPADAPAAGLRSPADFAGISDRAARSQALYAEAAKVIESPRCMNCHPAGDRPTQGNDRHPHSPPVARGADSHGMTGMRCNTCHQTANFEPSGVPGDPIWHLAPTSMAWQGKSSAQICRQIKDPAHNGKRNLAQIHEHMAQDHLVGWAWNPGGTRTPAPGTQAQFGALIQAWIDTGAVCPKA